MSAYYKASLTHKDGSTGYFIYKTVKGNIADVFKDTLIGFADKEKIASVELLWESENLTNLSFTFYDLLKEIGELRDFAGRSLSATKEGSDITETQVFEIRSIAREIKERAERLAILMECTNHWHEQPKEGHPVLVIDNFPLRWRPKKKAVRLR